MLDVQIVHPTLPVIMLGDFNIALEDRDSINRNANANKVNARRILKDLMYDIIRVLRFLPTLPLLGGGMPLMTWL